MGHFGKWTVMASTRKRMDETADALWWGMNMLERFRDYDADPAFPSIPIWDLLGVASCNGGGCPSNTSPPTTRCTSSGILGTRCGIRLP